MKKKWLEKIALSVVPPVYCGMMRLWLGTCRKEEMHTGYRDRCLALSGPFIVAFWHYSVLYMVYRGRMHNWVCMVSPSKDGEYIARILHRMGFVTVRASRGKGGRSALKGMAASMRSGRYGAIVADGSKGPARVLQPGLIHLGAMTGAPILPLACAADRCHLFGSWDRTMLPWPFSRVVINYGPPLTVPADAGAKELHDLRLELESRLNLAYDEAWRAVGRGPHDAGNK